VDIPDITIPEMLDAVARSHPRSQAVVSPVGSLTWSQMHKASTQLAAGLKTLGVQQGDRVGLLLPNVLHFPVAYYAVLRLGGIAVALNPLLAPGELIELIQKTSPSAIVSLDLTFDKLPSNLPMMYVIGTLLDFAPRWKRFAAIAYGRIAVSTKQASLVRRVAVLALRALNRVPALDQLKTLPRPRAPVPYGESVVPFRDALGAGPVESIGLKPAGPAVVLYTTGTTGKPSGVVLSHRNLLANAAQIRAWFPELKSGNETIMAVLPFFHAYGLTLAMNAGLILASRAVLVPRPDLGEIFKAIERYKPTALPGVPALFISLVNSERTTRYDLRSVRICVSGGAPLPVEIKERFDAITGGHLYEGYGLTEASPLTHAHPYNQPAPAGSVGLPVPGTNARIVDEGGNEVPHGQRGELQVQGPQVMLGYWNDLEATSSALMDGWLKTGDIATMDDRGFFWIVDRKKELIITGGENIAPREIEEVLYQHPAILECSVVGIPRSGAGEIAKAFIVLRPGHGLRIPDLKRWLSERLAHYKIPREYEFRSELPKSPVGKVLRRVLVDEELAARVSDEDSA
jgi:long-chain acyl-CoA synthetase